MKVIIAGAGVGGLALANGLVADGHAVRVLERAPAPRADGAAVTIFSNGAAAAAGLGVPLDGLGGPIETLEFHEPDGKPFGRTDLRVMRRRTGFGVATVPRSAILDRFAGRVAAGHRHLRLCGRRRRGRGRRRRGRRAFGGRSGRRRRLPVGGPAGGAGRRRRESQRLGELAGADPGAARAGRRHGSPLRRGPGRLCGLMPAGDGLLQWWFDVSVPAGCRSSSGCAPGSPVTPARSRSCWPSSPRTTSRSTRTCCTGSRRWGTGPSTLLGDAAHAFPPSQAQGANQALEDAWLLRRALSSGHEPGTACDGTNAYGLAGSGGSPASPRARSPTSRRRRSPACSAVSRRPASPAGSSWR